MAHAVASGPLGRGLEASGRLGLDGWSPGHNPGARSLFLHPAELRRRRERCRDIVDQLQDRQREFVAVCNICGSDRNAVVAQPDRYGFPSRTAMCLNCGLFYLVDRFSDADYAAFYCNGTYRRITSLFSGTGQGIGDLQADQAQYANELIGSLAGYVRFAPGVRFLDIGGSTGRVAAEFQNRFGMKGTVIDPAEAEVEAARRLGLNGVVGSVEEWRTDERFELILLCRSIEHVQDLRKALERIRELLDPNGLLFCDIVDFTEACRLVGHPEAVTKIDHCHWMTQESAPGIFRSVGLEVVSMNLAVRQPLAGFLLRAGEPSPCLPVDPLRTELQLRRLQQSASEWQAMGRTPRDAKDWLRRNAYLAKRKLLRLF